MFEPTHVGCYGKIPPQTRRYAIPQTGCRCARLASICFSSGAMNKLTSMPASFIFLRVSAMAFSFATNVQSAFGGHFQRRSGTMQTMSGFNFRAMAMISGAMAISRFSRVLTIFAQLPEHRGPGCAGDPRAGGAVMPCAPAASQSARPRPGPARQIRGRDSAPRGASRRDQC